MIAKFVHPNSPEWREVLDCTKHDVYHLPEYLTLAARHEGGTPTAFYAEDGATRFLAPLLVRGLPQFLEAPDSWLDAATPYGYPTPISSAQNAASLATCLRAFREVAAERGIVTAFFRLHPLLPLRQETLVKMGELVRHTQTVSVDLSLSSTDIWAQTRDNHKRDIRKLKEVGYEVRMDDWSLFDEFVRLYGQTMERVSASHFYLFSEGYFDDMRALLGKNLHLCTVLSPSGRVAAAGLFTTVCGIVQYHLGGTDHEYLRHAPSKLMFDHVRWWAKSSECHVFHLGGGVGNRMDSLFFFKAGFSRTQNDFYTYRVVLDSDRYDFLNAKWLEAHRRTDYPCGFFPLYRAEYDQVNGAS